MIEDRLETEHCGERQTPPGNSDQTILRWTALDAWKCLGIEAIFFWVVFSAVFATANRLSRDSLAKLNDSTAFPLVVVTLVGAASLLPAMYFSRAQNPNEFWKACGLRNPPTKLFWLGVLLAACIQFAYFGVDWLSLPQFTPFPSLPSSAPTPKQISHLLCAAVISPVWEEIVVRGFLYKAFRGTHSVKVSMCLMAIIMVLAHPSQAFSSLTGAGAVTVVSVTLCWLRERSPSLWDCIALHSVYNGLYVIGNLSRF